MPVFLSSRSSPPCIAPCCLNPQVESGVDKDGNSLSESDIAWGCPSEELFDEQLLSQVPLKLPPELLDIFWGFDCMAPAGLAPRLYAWLKVGQHILCMFVKWLPHYRSSHKACNGWETYTHAWSHGTSSHRCAADEQGIRLQHQQSMVEPGVVNHGSQHGNNTGIHQ
jgi:hypothetical protein